MKKLFFCAIAAMTAFAASAQTAYYTPSFGDNWSIGLDGGVTTPLARHHAFFGDMRGAFGLHIQKQISPVFALGVEGSLGVNTSSWSDKTYVDIFESYTVPGRSKTAFDNMYVGAYGSVNLFNLFGGYKSRVFDMELVAGAGWGHNFYNDGAFMPYTPEAEDQNYFVTKAGLNFNFNVCKNLTIALKPSVSFNMTGTDFEPLDVDQTSCAYNRKHAAFNLMASVNYNFGPGFITADTKNQAEIDALNATLNGLRAELDACLAASAVNAATLAALQAELEACLNRKPIEKIVDYSNSVRYVYYKFDSSVITGDQLPNVEMVASYLKNHPEATVEIKGYASKEGPEAYNMTLSQKRAEAVKNLLVKKYGISADRIAVKAYGETEMFAENAWNRVAICILKAE